MLSNPAIDVGFMISYFVAQNLFIKLLRIRYQDVWRSMLFEFRRPPLKPTNNFRFAGTVLPPRDLL